VEEVVRFSDSGRVGVIGTNSTIASGSYEKAFREAAPGYKIFSKACPLFVPLVENRMLKDKTTYQIAEGYLKGMKKKRIDALILGCTHYPLLKYVIGRVMRGVKLVDSSHAVSLEAKKILSDKGLSRGKRKNKGSLKCFVSDDVEGFRKAARMFLKEDCSVKKAVL
jgi:glutamate racemase